MWQERYRKEKHPQRRERAWAFRQPARGKSIRRVGQAPGRSRNTLHRWLRWYNAGGWEEVVRRTHGRRPGARQGSRLREEQAAALEEAARQGQFRTVWDVVAWVKENVGMAYSYSGMHAWLRRRGWRRKQPRPQGVKADEQAQTAWKKGG
ncbi:winged helix-turn-helix domain-containing protein [Ardenticatena maritima]|uniref:Winged helix-turn helix domain-containing protein n=1 Tax=Ardenticatena maritima TaxID=872965 RepID=A0A0P6XW23_9CHLR|nr:hypothetical protein SE16_10125 [Ardenticatena maritima]